MGCRGVRGITSLGPYPRTIRLVLVQGFRDEVEGRIGLEFFHDELFIPIGTYKIPNKQTYLRITLLTQEIRPDDDSEQNFTVPVWCRERRMRSVSVETPARTG